MWPWEHLAFGYVLYSGYVRLRHGHAPRHYPVIALAVATQVPDLVDKPLAWTFDVLPTARSFAHSLVVALAVVAVVSILARRRGVPEIGAAVAVGYLSHLLGDVLYHAVVTGGEITVFYLFWPFAPQPAREELGALAETARLAGEFVTFLGTPRGVGYLALELGFVLAVVLLWTADGWPGLRAHQ